jgi:hypothetical protein
MVLLRIGLAGVDDVVDFKLEQPANTSTQQRAAVAKIRFIFPALLIFRIFKTSLIINTKRNAVLCNDLKNR